jgi:type II secretory pathway predicted ATPase ExeA
MKQARPELLNVPITQYFGLNREPFSDNIKASELCELQSVKEISSIVELVCMNRIHFAFTGPTGSGKSTILRYVCDRQERLGNRVLLVNGGDWGFGEFLRQVMEQLSIDYRSYHPSTMIKLIQVQMAKSEEDGHSVLLAIDEADKLRNEVYRQLHLLVSSPAKGSSLASLLVCGQDALADKLTNPTAMPLRSRMYPGYYIPAINRQMYRMYAQHHMKLCGLRDDCIDDMALEHIWKATAGNLRSIGLTFRFALQYAANHDLSKVDAACAKAAFADWWDTSNFVDGFADVQEPSHAN